ncbi:MAG: metallophosphoesterase [Lachnospiraceae bacterium]
MSIFISSDIHGTKDIGKLVAYFDGRDDLTKDDFLIICGDVGVCGYKSDDERATITTLRKLPVTTLFCDGNHENFDKLSAYQEEEWNGGMIHRIYDDVIHLMRGHVYEIEDTTFYVFGGAYSVDRYNRIKGVTWFEEEVPNEEEIQIGWENLEKVDFNVDYVITHTAPYEALSALSFDVFEEEMSFVKELQRMADCMEFKQWFFGHLHEDDSIEEYTCVYDEIIEL